MSPQGYTNEAPTWWKGSNAQSPRRVTSRSCSSVTREEKSMDKSESKLLSDVHVHLSGQPAYIGGSEVTVSRFFFHIPKALEKNFGISLVDCAPKQTAEVTCLDEDTSGTLVSTNTGKASDQDGDLVLCRSPPDFAEEHEAVITIAHAMATDLTDVGQQVWLGALLLCDFLLHASILLEGVVVLDLGAGVGLTSIVAALTAQVVFCTDHGDSILRLALQNVENSASLPLKGDVFVRELDWMAEDPLCENGKGLVLDGSPFTMMAADLMIIQQCTVILAAEVVYDHNLTDAFFRVLYGILAAPPSKVVYMTVEKRQVFSTADLNVVSPAYTHFRENLAELSSVDEGPVRFVCSQIDTSFPQYFIYQRTRELELWKIETIFLNG